MMMCRCLGAFKRAAVTVMAVTLLVAMVMGGAHSVFAQRDVTFSASVDRVSLGEDELLTLELSLAGPLRMTGTPDLSVLADFDVVGNHQSSQLSFTGGNVKSQVVWVYRLRPVRSGALGIPAIPIHIGGQTLNSEPISVQVAPRGSGAPPARGKAAPADAASPAALGNSALYVEAEVDIPDPYVGQQVIYTFRFFNSEALGDRPRLDWPSFEGFLAHDLAPNNQYLQRIGQREYQVTEVRKALFPLSAGTQTIGVSGLEIAGSLFRRGVRLETEPVEIHVRALPAGEPAGFGGAVGRYQVEAWIDPPTTPMDEPVTLHVRVTGVGDLALVPDPTEALEDALPSWRVYDSKITTETRQNGDQIEGEKRVERLLFARNEGPLAIPALALDYFDPEDASYQRVTTEPLLVHVTQAESATSGAVVSSNDKQGLVVLASDIRHIKPAPSSLAVGDSGPTRQPWYWVAWLLPPLAVLVVWGWDRRRRRLSQDVSAVRASRAAREARKRLSRARSDFRRGGHASGYAHVAAALGGYVADRTGRSPAGLTSARIREHLAELGVDQELTERLLGCLDRADLGRFAPGAAASSHDGLTSEAERVIGDIEREVPH